MEPVGICVVADLLNLPLTRFRVVSQQHARCLDNRNAVDVLHDRRARLVLCSTPDAVVMNNAGTGVQAVVEVKTTAWEDFEEPPRQPHLYDSLQCAMHMRSADCHRAFLVYLSPGQGARCFLLRRVPAFERDFVTGLRVVTRGERTTHATLLAFERAWAQHGHAREIGYVQRERIPFHLRMDGLNPPAFEDVPESWTRARNQQPLAFTSRNLRILLFRRRTRSTSF